MNEHVLKLQKQYEQLGEEVVSELDSFFVCCADTCSNSSMTDTVIEEYAEKFHVLCCKYEDKAEDIKKMTSSCLQDLGILFFGGPNEGLDKLHSALGLVTQSPPPSPNPPSVQ